MQNPSPIPHTVHRRFRSTAARAVLGLACASAAWPVLAQSGPPSEGSAQGGRPPGPPPEAVAACKGKTEGAQVSFTLRDGKSVTGTCRTMDGQLAAMPDRMPPHGS